MCDIFRNFAFVQEMNFFFESNFVNLRGHRLSALTHALASENLVSLISLSGSGRPRPGQIDQGLIAGPFSAGRTVPTLLFSLEEQTAPQTVPKRSCSVWCVGPARAGCQVSQLPLPAFLGLALWNAGRSEWSSPSGALPEICIINCKGANHLGLCQGLWGRKFLQGDLPSPHLSLLCLCVFVHHSGNGNGKGSTQPD